MASYLFADVVHEALRFNSEIPSQAAVLSLIESPWVQRLRDIHQTANTRLVYMFSEHSRFGHSLGVAYMADLLMERLSSAPKNQSKIKPFRTAVAVAALIHDIGHLAPGSHTAFKAWFPKRKDAHEELAVKIILNDFGLNESLKRISEELPDLVTKILIEDEQLPPWTWQVISGGGWNVDRGNWCIVDSVFAGVSYGKYNISALVDSIILTDGDELALSENRIDAMMHFSVSRQALYRQVYQHRVLLAADVLTASVVARARDLGEELDFADATMKEVLAAREAEDLNLSTVFAMRESWWRYHLAQWRHSKDPTLSDLSRRLLDRDLFKTVRINSAEEEPSLVKSAEAHLSALGLDPKYYLHRVSTSDVHKNEAKSMQVALESGELQPLSKSDPLFDALGKNLAKSWLVMPAAVKMRLGDQL